MKNDSLKSTTPSPPSPHGVPEPSGRWKTRTLLPAAIFISAGGLLAWSGRAALLTSLPVVVMPVGLALTDAGARESETAAEPDAHQRTSASPSPPHTPTDSAKHHDNARPTGEPIVQAAGWVEADPFPVGVAALTDGVVEEVLALEGQAVEAGQVLVRLVWRDAELALTRAEAELTERQAELEMAQVEQAAAQETWDNPVERTRALAGARGGLAEAKADEQRAGAQAAADRARLAELRDETERKRALGESGGVSQGELARIELRLKAAESQAAAAESEHTAASARVGMKEAELAAAEQGSKLRTEETRVLGAARARAAQARGAVARATVMRDEAKLRLERMNVRSPIAGVVLSRMVEPGSRVQMFGAESGRESTGGAGGAPGGATVMRLYDPARLQVRVDVPLAEAWKLEVGQAAEVTCEAMPGRVIRGRLTRIVAQADITRNTLQVKVSLGPISGAGESGNGVLKPEMLTRVRFFGKAGGDRSGPTGATQPGESHASAAHDGVTMLARAADLDRSGSNANAAAAWVVDQQTGRAERREVRLAGPINAAGGWVRITDGVRPGDRIIVSPAKVAGLKPGSRVRIVEEQTVPEMSAGESPNEGGAS